MWSHLPIASITYHLPPTFNLRYVYKRLKFLNNRYISQGAALLFLAVWHGMYVGYYICFGLEMFVTTTETFVSPVYLKK